MVERKLDQIVLQEKLTIILTATLDHVYKDIFVANLKISWTNMQCVSKMVMKN